MWTDDWYFERGVRGEANAPLHQITQNFDYLRRQIEDAIAVGEQVRVRPAVDATNDEIDWVKRSAAVLI
jgi:hypothetical protein